MAQLAPRYGSVPPGPRVTPREMPWSPRLWREPALIVVFYDAYTLVRLLIPHDETAAYDHADRVLGLPARPAAVPGGQGFVDPVTAFHSFGLYSSPQAGSFTNQFAAMPSMHARRAHWCAVAVIVNTRRRPIMVAAALYPIVTITVIFATANHYLLDAVAGVIVMAFALFVGIILHLRENRPCPSKDHKVTNKTTVADGPGVSV